MVNCLVHAETSQCLPTDSDPEVNLADRFCSFFAEKSENIIKSLDNASSSDLTHISHVETDQRFDEFDCVLQSQVAGLITRSRSTTCGLDPMPTDLVKKCVNELSPVITCIANMSLRDGCFPDVLKLANISPLIKASKLDSEDLGSYRPIAHIQFLGKTIERLVNLQIQDHLVENHLYASMQSAYRPYHSCESAVLRVVNDILLALDRGNEAVLLLLDYRVFVIIRHHPS